MTKDFIYLASASPRRGELLSQIGVPFRVQPADILEQALDAEQPADYVERLALAKADTVWNQVLDTDAAAPVLAADTIVVVDDTVFGKPTDRENAMKMLERLSGRSHSVLTAVAIRFEQQRECRVTISEVRFRATTEQERAAYCGTQEPLDKAGGYGIQGFGAVFIDRLFGSYSAVMGLPLCETVALLKPFELPRWLHADAIAR